MTRGNYILYLVILAFTLAVTLYLANKAVEVYKGVSNSTIFEKTRNLIGGLDYDLKAERFHVDGQKGTHLFITYLGKNPTNITCFNLSIDNRTIENSTAQIIVGDKDSLLEKGEVMVFTIPEQLYGHIEIVIKFCNANIKDTVMVE